MADKNTIVIFGDVHGKWKKVNSIVNHEVAKNGLALSTGDLGNYNFEPSSGQKLFFCYGNHENFRYIQQLLSSRKGNLQVRTNGEIFEYKSLTIAALSGVYSPIFLKMILN